ncbi:MAG: signal peptidase II [Acidobacteriota bacterium]|nr:signal peptidase II [Acidobacteriota bacterium]
MKKKGIKLFLTATLTALGLAQLSSFLVEKYLVQYQSREVLPFLYLTHVRNDGGIFGLFQGSGAVFSVLSIVFLGILVYYVTKEKNLRLFEYLCYGLILGGGLSNITDRLVYGSVIDFIDVRGIPGWEYIFNTADVMIHVGIWPLILFTLFMVFREAPKKEAKPAGNR